MSEQRQRRVSVTVREGPKEESRVERGFKEAVHDVFSCCESETTCQHRKNLSTTDRRLSATTWQKVSDIPREIFPFAMESTLGPDPDENGNEGAVGSSKRISTTLHNPKQDVVTEKMDDFQRAIHCLKSSPKTFAVANFDRLIKENEARAMAEVWPRLEQELRNNTGENDYDANFQETAASRFPYAVVELYKTANGNAARKLLALTFDFILNQNTELSTVWVTCLEKLVEVCNSSDVQKDIYPTIVGRFIGSAEKTSTVNGKVGACRLLRKLAARFSQEVIEKRFFPMMERLCGQDEDPRVRAAAAGSLAEMIHRLKSKDAAIKLINSVSKDGDPEVRTAITGSIVQSVVLMGSSAKSKRYLDAAMQAIKGLVKDAYVNGNYNLLIAYSQCMGRISRAFSEAKIMKPRDSLWYLDAFIQLSRLNIQNANSGETDDPVGFANFRANMEFARKHSILEQLVSTKPTAQSNEPKKSEASTSKVAEELRKTPQGRRMSVPFNSGAIKRHSTHLKIVGPEQERARDCRINAAKEFYDFMIFAHPIVNFRTGLHPLMVTLLHDPEPEVRAAMAEKILPIMEYLQADASLLHGEFVYALSDDDLSVIEALVPQIAKILTCLVTARVLSPEEMTVKLVEIGGALLYCEERVNQSTFYSVHQTMLEQFSILPFCIPGDYIYHNFLPALFHRLRHMRQVPCRMAAANAIVIFLRQCRRAVQREAIRRRIIDGFAKGHSVHDRMLFLYIAKQIMDTFSRKYFRNYFFESVVALANDSVANVRQRVIEILPELQNTTDEVSMHRKLEESVRTARKSETDRDVKSAMDDVLGKIRTSKPNKKHQINMNMSAMQLKPPDPADEMKEAEENYIASLEPKY